VGRQLKKLALVLRDIFTVLAVASLSTFASADQVPKQYVSAVVAIGSTQFVPTPGSCSVQWVTEGTGFLYGYLVKDDPDPAKREYQVFLVTNRHVIEEHAVTANISKLQQAESARRGEKCPVAPTAEGKIGIRINPLNSQFGGRSYDEPITNWFFHPNKDIDVAVVHLNLSFLEKEGLEHNFFANDQAAATKEKLKNLGVAAGDGVFVVGFPMNLAGAQRNYAIVRQGCVARITDMLDGNSLSYLLDTFIFPGNSGSPVFLKPEPISIAGTPAQKNAYLIGIVRAYVPYTDISISQQSKHLRGVFEENSGLAEVIPTDYIDETIRFWLRPQSQPK